MSKILMVDYYGACDRQGKAVGHSPKVAKEYRTLFSEKDKIDLAVSPCIAAEVEDAGFGRIYRLPYNIVEADYDKISKRILDKVRILQNIHRVRQIRGYDLVWYYRVDFFLMLYMLFSGKRKGRQICLVYQMGGGTGIVGRLMELVYQKGIRRFDGAIYTQPQTKIPVKYSFYMPDYRYSKEKYAGYAALPREEKAVCLGAMNPYKKLEELVGVFNESGYPLEIVGYFFDKDRLQRLKEMANSNIHIEDRILSEEEYYRKLGTATYSVLPYDMAQYQNRTSGILLESAFLETIPVAPQALLETNGMAGIGYRLMNEMPDKIIKCQKKEIINRNNERIRNNFDEKKIKAEFLKWMFFFRQKAGNTNVTGKSMAK